MSGPILGIDIGGTKLAVGVATPDGRLLSDMRRPSDAADGPDAMIERVLDMSRAAVNDAGLTLDEVDAIGIGCGGPLDPWSGVILNALNNTWTTTPTPPRLASIGSARAGASHTWCTSRSRPASAAA